MYIIDDAQNISFQAELKPERSKYSKMKLQQFFKMGMVTKKLTGPCLKEAIVKMEDDKEPEMWIKEKYSPFGLTLFKGNLKKRAQRRPFFTPYPQLLNFIRGFMANRKDNGEHGKKDEDMDAMKKREKEGKHAKARAARISLQCRIFPPACKEIYSYHL